jgi:RNA polymerase sigma factor (sigma-70 family)
MLPLAEPTPPDLDVWYREEVAVHEPALRAYLRRAFPVVTDVDNLVQESFVRVVHARRNGAVEKARGYLFTTARHLALELLRRRKIISIDSIAEIEALPISTDEPGVPEKVGLKLDLELLTQAIQALPERCRAVLTLRKIEGLSQREIATRLGIAEHTVEAQVANGMRRCAQYLRERGVLPVRESGA